MSKISAKKRLMYLSSEDFYLYCYSIFVILDSLGCKNGRYFRDYRKLAFLIDIIGNDKAVYIITHSSGEYLNYKDHECLTDSYTNGLTRRSEILKILFVLEKKGYINLKKGNSQEINVALNIDGFPTSFLNNNVFDSEIQNIKIISKTVKRLTSLTLETMMNKIYTDNGVRTWG